jgi:hypothetical protein
MTPSTNAQSTSDEHRIQLALQAINQDATLSLRSAAAIYNVRWEKVRNRRNGATPRRETMANSMKLTLNEEQTIVDYILDLDARGFAPRIAAVRDMANKLLTERDQGEVGQRWPNNFIKRRLELKTRFNRKYDYQRAKQEDPIVIGAWFNLVRNTKAKYGITDEDTYNFDESGFMIGMISTGSVVTGSERRSRPKGLQPGNREWISSIITARAVGATDVPPFVIVAGKTHLSSWYEGSNLPRNWVIAVSENGWTTNKIGIAWLKHFNAHTKDRTVGAHRLLILDGHESHDSLEFQQFCKENKIVSLCMPPHSSHLLQPLDVGCFSSLKTAYGRQVENLMRSRINHVTKLEFLPAFNAAFNASITDDNIKGGFRGAGLVPFNPDVVLSKLEVQLRTPTPPLQEAATWECKTPGNLIELRSQSTLIRTKITTHLDSSPTHIVESLNRLEKGNEMIAHRLQYCDADLR